MHSLAGKFKSYLNGSPTASGLFDTPLLKYRDLDGNLLNEPPPDLLNFYQAYLTDTPILRSYLPHIERPHPTYGAPFLEESEIDARRLQKAHNRDPSDQAENQDPERIAALVAVDIDVRRSAAAGRSTVGKYLVRHTVTPAQ